MVHFDELRPQIRNWMATWYFLRSREANHLTQGDDLALKERRHCQSLLDTYLKMRKSSQEQVIFTQKYLQMQLPDTNVITMPKGAVANTGPASEGAKGKGSKGDAPISENEMEQTSSQSST